MKKWLKDNMGLFADKPYDYFNDGEIAFIQAKIDEAKLEGMRQACQKAIDYIYSEVTDDLFIRNFRESLRKYLKCQRSKMKL